MMQARELGLDLVEVASAARPPVCRIMDYGKYKYEQKKQERKARAHRHEAMLKLIRIRTPKISPHDLGIKINNAKTFLARGDRVQFTVVFRGREMAHQELGRELLYRVKASMGDGAKVDRDVNMEGRAMSLLLAATTKSKQWAKAKPADAEAAYQAAEAREAREAADDADDAEGDEHEAPAAQTGQAQPVPAAAPPAPEPAPAQVESDAPEQPLAPSAPPAQPAP